MVWLHALKRMDEHSPTREVKGLFLSLDGSLHGTPGPERMVHRAPRVLRVSAKIRGPIFTDHQTWRRPGEGQLHQTIVVNGGFDGVGIGFFVEGDAQVIRAEGKHALIEHEILQGIGMPVVETVAFEIVDLCIELSSGMNAPIRRPGVSQKRRTEIRQAVLTRYCCK